MKKSFVNIALIVAAAGALTIAYIVSKDNSPVRDLPYFGPKKIDSTLVNGKYKTDTVYHTVSNFKLMSQEGHVVTLDSFKDKIIATDFFFTTCHGICPKLQGQMGRAVRAFKNNPNVKFISNTVDPEHDSVSVLAAYAAEHNAQPYQWYFLTGAKKELYNLARKSYFVAASKGNGGATDFVHTQNIALVDANHHIRGFYDGIDSTDVDRMIVDIKILLAEQAQNKKKTKSKASL